jgi:hypothetical protein
VGVVRRSETLAAVGAEGEDARRTAAGTAALLLQGVLFRRGLLAAPFLFMDEKNDNSGMEREKEMIDLQAVADENPKRKGEMIEAAFLAKVCKLRIPVCKPWGDSERYDFVVDWGKGFWSVQVKGGTSHKRSGYKVESGRDGRVFTKDDMDFVVVYIVPEDLWYVVPVEIAEGRSSLWFTPGSARARLAKYREAWCLLDCGLEERGLEDIPVRCRSEAVNVRCAVCPLRQDLTSQGLASSVKIRPRRLK